MSADQFVQYLTVGLTQGCTYALIGLGFTIIYAVTRIINFAQGEFIMLGGLLSFSLATSAGLPLSLAIIIAILSTVIIGIILYLLAIRTARKASIISLIIITIGASIFIRGIASQVWGPDFVRPDYFSGNKTVSFLGAYIHYQALWVIGITVLVTILLYLFLSHTMLGKAFKSCAINPEAAKLVGINTKAMALIAFGMAAAIGSIGGTVLAPITMARYDMGVLLGLKGFVAAAVGGFMSPITTVIGGIILGIVENLAIALNWGPFTSAYKDVIAIIVLLIILLIRSGKLAAEERAG